VPEPDQTVIVHIKIVTSLVEGRPVSFSEVFSMVRFILRQHSMGWLANFVYKVPNPNDLPP
jgi:hypothetical protein